SAIPKQEIGNATGMFNLLRNIGGSVGIAVAATMLGRLSQFYQTVLVPHINQYNPVFQLRFEQLKQALITKGLSATQADQGALTMLYGMVRQQAATLAYNRIFFIVGLAFLAIIPLLLLLKRPKHQTGPLELH
ncbi:MAG: EmrB/QacA family drug resistance transporter, partial [Candidatus Cloacimonetes bacterium]|nr:EmrB/QacA family drug resistance transporter [Candidatus Cloacimonadota bacterium]